MVKDCCIVCVVGIVLICYDEFIDILVVCVGLLLVWCLCGFVWVGWCGWCGCW